MEVENKSALTKFWENIEINICFVAMLFTTLITFTQVIARYGFNYSFSWAEEVCRMLLCWVTFAGSAYAFRVGAHIGVEALVHVLPGKLGKGFVVIARLLTYVFFILLLYYGTGFTLDNIARGHLTPALRIPTAVGVASVPVGALLVLIRLAYMDYTTFRQNHRQEVH